MRTDYDSEAMARDLEQNGLDAEQAERHDLAFKAAKIAAVALLCARYGVDESELLESLMDSRNLNAQVHRLVARIEVSSAFVAHIHSGHPF
jgi:hypothetical protein